MRKMLIVTVVIAALSPMMLLFNNFSSGIPAHLRVIMDEAASLQKDIDDPGSSEKEREYYRALKFMADNLLASKVTARTCADLRVYDPTLQNGRYLLYPSGDLLKPVPTDCPDMAAVMSVIIPFLLEE